MTKRISSNHFIPYLCNMKKHLTFKSRQLSTIFWLLIAGTFWIQFLNMSTSICEATLLTICTVSYTHLPTITFIILLLFTSMQWTDSVVSIIIPHALDTKRILHCPVARLSLIHILCLSPKKDRIYNST